MSPCIIMLVYAIAKILSHIGRISFPVGERHQPNDVAIYLVDISASSISTA